MNTCLFLTLLAVTQAPSTSQPSVRELLAHAWSECASPGGAPRLLQRLRDHGITTGQDLLPYLDEGPRMAAAALMLLGQMESVDDDVRARVRSALPSLDGQAEMWAVRVLLKDADYQSAEAILPQLKSSGLYALLSWCCQNDNPDLALAVLKRARYLVTRQFTNYTLFEIFSLADKPLLKQPILRGELVSLGVAACTYPENVGSQSLLKAFEFLLEEGARVNRQFVEQELARLITEAPDPLPGIICWQIFRVGVQHTPAGAALLRKAEQARPELRELITMLSESRFTQAEPFGQGEVRTKLQAMMKDRSKLRSLRSPAPSTAPSGS